MKNTNSAARLQYPWYHRKKVFVVGLIACLFTAVVPTMPVYAKGLLEDILNKAKEEFNRSISGQGDASQRQASGAQSGLVANPRTGVREVDPRIFFVQGVTTGMARDEVIAKLRSSGWKPAGGGGTTGVWSKQEPHKSKMITIEFKKVGDEVQAAYIKYTIGFLTPKVDTDLLARQVVKKFGQPHSTQYGGLTYWQYPDAPTEQELVKTCSQEMLAKNMPAFQARGRAQPITNAVQIWISNDYRAIMDNCPRTMPVWKRYLQQALGKRLDITIMRVRARGGRSASGNMTFELREERVRWAYQRQLTLQRQAAARRAPQAAMDESDF